MYYKGELIEGADPETFEVLNEYSFSKDKEHIWYQQFDDIGQNIMLVHLESADPQTFKVLSPWYAKDQYNVYSSLDYSASLIFEADPQTFVTINEYYGKDKNEVYFYGSKIAGANSETFVGLAIPETKHVQYAKDVNYVYYRKGIIAKADIVTFEVVSDRYTKDMNYVYSFGKIVEGSNPENCTAENLDGCEGIIEKNELPEGYEIKEDGVYYQGELIERADSKTFKGTPEFLVDPCYASEKPYYEAEDANHKYLYGRMIAEVQKSVLTKITEGVGVGSYYKDKNSVYLVSYVSCDGVHAGDGPLLVMDEFDSDTIKFIGTCQTWEGTGGFPPDYIFKDKNGIYCGNTFIESADPETFKIIGSARAIGLGTVSYSIDKESVFEGGRLLIDKDPNTFKVPEEYRPTACLAPDTKILMSDGSYKNIENIKVGDLVTSYEIETKEYKTAKVDKVIKRKDPLVIINDTLRAAPDEPVYLANGNIKEAIDIKTGDHLLGEKGNAVKVIETRYDAQVVDTYDFTLENSNNFFADGYLVGIPDL